MEHPEIRENTNLVSENANVVIEEWKAEHRVLRVTTQSGGWVALRLANYPPWRVTLNGKRIIAKHSKETAQMIVPVPAGESELRADFVRTLDRSIGGGISIATLCGSIFSLMWKRRVPATIST